ncbi:hypothetical protein PIB30_113119, partial [Stylosanthes scabra]|nr:hypothetical protein [Stylosanthes scabra]
GILYKLTGGGMRGAENTAGDLVDGATSRPTMASPLNEVLAIAQSVTPECLATARGPVDGTTAPDDDGVTTACGLSVWSV